MTKIESIKNISNTLVNALIVANKTVATAESCTGGWIAKSITDIPGSSKCFLCGMVTYSDQSKKSILGINSSILNDHGVVSEAVVREMSDKILKMNNSDLSVAVSGIAGPGGGSEDKPVGTVWISWSISSEGEVTSDAIKYNFIGERKLIRKQAVIIALKGLLERLVS